MPVKNKYASKISTNLFELRNKLDVNLSNGNELDLIDECAELVKKLMYVREVGKKGAQRKPVDTALLKKIYFEEKRSLEVTARCFNVSTHTIYRRLREIGETRTIQEGMEAHFERKYNKRIKI